MKNINTLFAGAISILLNLPAYAESGVAIDVDGGTSDVYNMSLEELVNVTVTSAGLLKQTISSAPATMYVFRQEDFRRYGFRELKDILRFVPGIEFSDDSKWAPGGQRGFPGSWAQTKLLVDGRDVNNLFSGEAFISAQFPLYSLERVEIVQGPASALYGSDAFVGIINLITRKATTGKSEGEIFHTVGSQQKTGDNSSTAARYSRESDSISLATHAYTYQGKGVDYSNFVKSEKFSLVNRDERVSALNEGRANVLSEHASEVAGIDLGYENLGPGKLSLGSEYRKVVTHGTQQYPDVTFNARDERNQVSSHVTYNISGSGPVFKSLEVTYQNLYDDVFADAFGGKVDNLGKRTRVQVRKSWLQTVRAQSQFDIPSVDNSLVLGSRYRRIDLSPIEIGGASDPSLQPFLKQTEYSLYFEDAQKLLGDRLVLTTGYRFDHNDGYGGVHTLRGALVGKLSDHLTAKALFGQAFRQPTVIERARARDIKPSLMESKELVLQYSKANQYAQVSYFWNDATDLIVRRAQSGLDVALFGNIGKQSSRGVETYYRIDRGNYYGTAWYTYTLVPGDENIAPHKAAVSVGYNFHRDWSVNLLSKWTSSVKEQVSIAPAEASPYGSKVEDFYQTNLNLVGSKISVSGNLPALDLTFSVKNLFNRVNYLPYVRGPSPVQFLDERRTFWLMGSIAF